jgi:hypothetical protein
VWLSGFLARDNSFCRGVPSISRRQRINLAKERDCLWEFFKSWVRQKFREYKVAVFVVLSVLGLDRQHKALGSPQNLLLSPARLKKVAKISCPSIKTRGPYIAKCNGYLFPNQKVLCV